MHETSLMNDLMKKILTLAHEQHAEKITRVSIRLGALSHLSPTHFKEHFDHAAQGTLAQGAEIDAELSDSIDDPNALDVVLKSIDIVYTERELKWI